MKIDNYNPKLKVVDKYNIQHIIPNKRVNYSGDLDLIKWSTKKDNDINNSHRPLAAAVLGLDNTAAPLPNDLRFCHTWTDIDSQELYLNSKPMCYLILGKPGTGAYSLGESMAKKLNVVHLSPKNVLVDEIEQGSVTGKCIDFNLRHNNVCKYDVIIEIMKSKLESPVIQHRGYVISGLPLTTSNTNMPYFNKSLHEEESILIAEDLCNDLLTNVYKKKGKKKLHGTSKTSDIMVETESDIEEEEEEQEQEIEGEEATEQIVALPKFILDPCSGIILLKKSYLNSKQTVLLYQCQELFNCTLKPDIIIFITCPDPDAITKKNHKYFNYAASSNPMGSHPFLTRNETEIRWPNKYVVFDNIINTLDNSLLNRKYCCRLPINFNSNSTNQMCNYKTHVRPFLDKKIREFPSNFVLKLDGRNSSHEMLNLLLGKLLLLPIKPILIPEPLYLEEPSEDVEDFWKMAEEMNVIKCGVQTFGRFASPWYNRCPVELKKRHSVQGLAKYAVAFFNRIYLLSSLDGMVAFCRNPRPFLKLQFLEPTCRIIVTGTKSSGKSMISQCLSWLFNSPVICYDKFLDNIKKNKYEAFCISISSEIIATVDRERVTKWELEEQDRISNLNTWISATTKMLNRYIYLSKQYASITAQEVYDINKSKQILNELNRLRQDLDILPILDDIEMCAKVLKSRSVSQYAPPELATDIPKPALPVLGDDDVTTAITKYIMEKNLEKDIEPSAAEIMLEINSKLADFDLQNTDQSKWEYKYGKYIIDGFPIDMEMWDFLFGSPLFPDYIITIIEDREIDEDIAEHYINLDISPKSYESRFNLANDGLIKTKLLSGNLPETQSINSITVAQDLINGIIQLMFVNKSEVLNNLNETINKFREDWETLKVNLIETSKSCIEVQIENKTDIEILEEVLLKIRRSYSPPGNSDIGDVIEDYGSEESLSNDPLISNDPRFLCETNIYCPISYNKYGVLWEGKTEFGLKYDNKLHYFCKEEFLTQFQNDVTKYQTYNNPFKKVPSLKICVIGSTGSGRTSVAKFLAKEYGLIHIDIVEFINSYLLPRHYKKVGRQYENSFTDTPIDEDTMAEINMNEDNLNLELDILSNENELRRIVYGYLEKGTPLVSILMQKILKKLWFDPPFSSTGFILDGFPKMQSDIEDMIECFCIPDLIIELECNSEVSTQRLTPKMFTTWKSQLNDAKIKSRIKLDNEKLQWRNFITEKVVVNLIIDEIIDNIVIEPTEPLTNLSVQSAIIEADPLGLSNVEANLFNIYNNLILEYPEPIDTSEWENPDDARERINYSIEGIYEIEDENIQSLKDTLEEHNIKLTSVDGTKPFEKVGRVLLSKVASLRLKRERCFEQTFVIDFDVAEVLLLEGLFFLSKFYRMCPVFIHDNPDAIFRPFNISKTNNKITSVIHRSHIYFISNKNNLKKFRENPLKYILNENIKYFYEYPLRIAVLGPPKSGKSELTAKLAKKYGLVCVSKGIALRYVVNNLSWTDLALKLMSKLQKGESICNNTVIEAVQTVINNQCSASRGFVLDGLPSSPFEAMELQKRGLFPLNIFDLRADKAIILKNSQKEIYPIIIKRKPPYPSPFIAYRFSKYMKECNRVKEYVNNDTQNMNNLNGNLSRWKCFYEADNVIDKIIPPIHYYLTNYSTKIVPMAALCVSDDDFQLKMSKYKNFCPVCLQKNVIKHSGYPVDKKGVVQYKENFYWVCREHCDLLLKDPSQLLEQYVDIPEVPAVVKTINHCNLYEDGVCIVTYAENLPAQFIEKGKEDFAAVYKDKTYLFCNAICLQKFLATPHIFYDITVFKECKIFPQILLKQLPHLGYLEQTVGTIITEACCYVHVLRPKYPGLTIQISALLYIALYLKVHNKLTKASHLPLYTKSLRIFQNWCQLVTSVGLRLRAIDNPFANYPKCCNTSDVSKESDSGTVIKPSSFKIESNLSLDCSLETG